MTRSGSGLWTWACSARSRSHGWQMSGPAECGNHNVPERYGFASYCSSLLPVSRAIQSGLLSQGAASRVRTWNPLDSRSTMNFLWQMAAMVVDRGKIIGKGDGCCRAAVRAGPGKGMAHFSPPFCRGQRFVGRNALILFGFVFACFCLFFK